MSKSDRWRLPMPLLRGAAIVLPLLFLAIVDVLRHTVLLGELHSPLGFLFTYAVIAAAIVLFSYAIFGLINRLQREIGQRNQRLLALNHIAKVAGEKLGLDELLATSLDHILSVMKADAGLICIVDLEKEEHSAVSSRGLAAETVARIQRAKLRDDPIAQEVVRSGRPVIMERVMEDPRVAQAAAAEGIKSAVSAPLKSEGEVDGILVVATRRERRFSAADKEFLEGIGGQLGMAIRNAVLYEQSQLRNRELQALVAVGKAVSSSLRRDDVLNKALDTILEVMPIDAAEIWLVEDAKELVMQCHRGASREAFQERPRFAVGEGFPGLVVQSGEPLLVHDLPSDPRFMRQQVVKAGFHTFYAFPLQYLGRPIGVLAVAAFAPDALKRPADLALLDGIGERVAVAIENARLHEQVQDLAVLQERERLAREMHDGMAQLLGYINTQTLAVKRLLHNAQVAEAQGELTKMEEIARDLYADVREGIVGLKAAALGGQGLFAALRGYVERWREMAGLDATIRVMSGVEDLALPSAAEVQLVRIVQEALSNVRKHARAASVHIVLQRSDHEFSVEVADNGQGFDPVHLPPTGWPRFGLQTMRERAQAVGATLTIETAPGKGTRVLVRLPLSQDQDYPRQR